MIQPTFTSEMLETTLMKPDAHTAVLELESDDGLLSLALTCDDHGRACCHFRGQPGAFSIRKQMLEENEPEHHHMALPAVLLAEAP
jgi:hypothetical protein